MEEKSKKELLNYVANAIVRFLHLRSADAKSYILARLKNKKSRQLIYSALKHSQRYLCKRQYDYIDNLLNILHCIYGDVL